MLADYQADPEKAEYVWGGGYELVTEASYYGRLMAADEKEGRIGDFPYDPAKGAVVTSWDLGVDDYTAIVFWQTDGLIPTVVDFYEASNIGNDIVDYALPELLDDIPLAAARLLELGRDKPYRYRLHHLPHDIKVREWGSGGKQRSLTLMQQGIKPLHVGVATNPADRINAVRALLPYIRFNDTPRVWVLISHLRRYSRKYNQTLAMYMGELHDEHSHAADATGEFAINYPMRALKAIEPPKPSSNPAKSFSPAYLSQGITQGLDYE